MKWVGAHVSIAGGLAQAPLRARQIGGRALALFTRNQRRWEAPPLTAAIISDFKAQCAAHDFSPAQILVHDSYLINLGHPDTRNLEKSRTAFTEEMRRCEQLGLTRLNFHPGSHLGKIGEPDCLRRIAESINLALEHTTGITAVIENTAGQGNTVGSSWAQIARIMEGIQDKQRLGFCLDTAHAFAAGYDFRTWPSYDRFMGEIQATVGLEYLKGVHLNDSRAKLGSRVDRHENIGQGELGLAPFRNIMNDHRFDDLPLILETRDNSRWPREIKLLYRLIENPAVPCGLDCFQEPFSL